jgi:hypothetical protein
MTAHRGKKSGAANTDFTIRNTVHAAPLFLFFQRHIVILSEAKELCFNRLAIFILSEAKELCFNRLAIFILSEAKELCFNRPTIVILSEAKELTVNFRDVNSLLI